MKNDLVERAQAALVSHAADVLLVLDADGVALRRVGLGDQSSEAVDGMVQGTPLAPRVHPEDLDAVLAAWRSVAGVEGAGAEVRVRMRRVEDPDRWQYAVVTCVGLADAGDGALAVLAAELVDGDGLKTGEVANDGFSLADAAPVGLAVYSVRHAILWANEAFLRDAEVEVGPTTAEERRGHGVLNVLEHLVASAGIGEEGLPKPVVVSMGDKSLRVQARQDPNGGHLLVSVQNITDELASIRDRARANATFRAAFDHSQAGIAIVSLQGEFVDVNPAFSNITGFEADELVGSTFAMITHPDDLDVDEEYVAELLAGTRDSYRMEKRYLRWGGGVVWVDLRVAVVKDDHGRPEHFVANVVDISERVSVEEQLRQDNVELSHRATHDHLTGLPNRLLLERHLEVLAEGYDDGVHALVCDLDRFKAINDEHGHQVGDAVLVEVAKRLRDCCRDDDLVARVGGDEFVVLARTHMNPDTAARLGERLVDAVKRRIQVGDITVDVGLSIGISPVRADIDSELALRLADQAAYEIKSQGGGALLVPC
ncbi:MAG: diguanylate cyclase [Microthrixaceae bacterium]|nr:diguanylate cyclase [Microthrixaceae bacterium]